ncbi:hypothetical protein D3C84_956540 [compost metagenome]
MLFARIVVDRPSIEEMKLSLQLLGHILTQLQRLGLVAMRRVIGKRNLDVMHGLVVLLP